MTTCGIICEYNPFHMGHEYQINEIRKQFPDSVIISIQSGNIVQRGELSVFDKYSRAKHAIFCGADLVLELPYPWSGASAEFFASAGISILDGIDCENLIFGSNCGDIKKLTGIADNLSSNEFLKSLNEFEKDQKHSSVSHMEAICEVYRKLYSNDLDTTSNDTLALEYLKALKIQKSEMTPITIMRNFNFSATKSREILFSDDRDNLSNLLPEKVFDDIKDTKPTKTSRLGKTFIYDLTGMEKDTKANIMDASGGLLERLINSAKISTDYDELIANAKSKKFTDARIKRTLFNIINDITENDVKTMPKYSLLLGATKKGSSYLREISKSKKTEILTKPADYKKLSADAQKQFEKSMKADYLWALASDIPTDSILRQTPYIKND